jgi:hypothetical protein
MTYIAALAVGFFLGFFTLALCVIVQRDLQRRDRDHISLEELHRRTPHA